MARSAVHKASDFMKVESLDFNKGDANLRVDRDLTPTCALKETDSSKFNLSANTDEKSVQAATN